MLRALERLERRTTEVAYKQRQWFTWVRQCQEVEEDRREAEKKVVKREAAMLRRHKKEFERRMRALREKEKAMKQDKDLEEANEERMDESEADTDSDWDPIDDAVEGSRGKYVDLISRILLMDDEDSPMSNALGDSYNDTPMPEKEESSKTGVPFTPSGKEKRKHKKTSETEQSEPGSVERATYESREDMRKRLGEGQIA